MRVVVIDVEAGQELIETWANLEGDDQELQVRLRTRNRGDIAIGYHENPLVDSL